MVRAAGMALLVVAFSIPHGASASAPVAADAAARDDGRDDLNKVICRRMTETGSFAKSRRVCQTRAEWIEQARQARQFGEDIQQRGLINSCQAADRSECG